MENRGETWQLAEFIAGLKPADIPASVQDVIRAATIDSIGCGLFGLTTPAGRIVQDYAAGQAGPAEASLWAHDGPKVSAANVALAAGTAIHAFDFDDHHRTKIHPGAAVLPVALALGEQHGASGERFLTAMAAGYETMARVSLGADPNAARMRGWHLTGTAGTFAAAAAAAVMLGLDAATTASALGLAGTQSAGLWAFNADGAMSKRLHPGRAAQAGIVAAQLAMRGFEGPRHILETSDGGFLAAMSDKSDPARVVAGLGSRWLAEGVCFKPYSCCGSNHASIDAVLLLQREHGFGPGDIERIRVGISRVVERQTGFPYRRSTVLNAQMSIRYDVAVAVLDGNALIEQFTPERIAAPDVNELVSRVDVEIDAEMDAVYPERYAGIVTVELKDGRRLGKRVDYSRGMPENRMSPDEMKGKFLSLSRAAIGDEAAAWLAELTASPFDLADVATLAEALGSLRLREGAGSGIEAAA